MLVRIGALLILTNALDPHAGTLIGTANIANAMVNAVNRSC